jgi:hypothetical protein
MDVWSFFLTLCPNPSHLLFFHLPHTPLCTFKHLAPQHSLILNKTNKQIRQVFSLSRTTGIITFLLRRMLVFFFFSKPSDLLLRHRHQPIFSRAMKAVTYLYFGFLLGLFTSNPFLQDNPHCGSSIRQRHLPPYQQPTTSIQKRDFSQGVTTGNYNTKSQRTRKSKLL